MISVAACAGPATSAARTAAIAKLNVRIAFGMVTSSFTTYDGSAGGTERVIRSRARRGEQWRALAR
jgi:hypothetical protein